MEPNIRAFLKVIRTCEGTDGADGYFKTFDGGRITDLSKHPNKVHVHAGKKTSPAGAYQIVYSTWVWIQTFISLPDFRPPSQDAAAVWLLKYRKAYDHVIAGRFDQAIAKCRSEWTSLPGASQASGKSFAAIKTLYLSSGGKLA